MNPLQSAGKQKGCFGMSVPTPHIEAKQGDFAPTVLMPGDPAARPVHCRALP